MSARADGRDIHAAIRVKKEQAEANRRAIAQAIITLQGAERPVNVASVARVARVHPTTVRRNPELMEEVRRLRGSHQHTSAATAAPDSTLTRKKAQLAAAREEIRDLRRELANLRRATHQALGSSTGSIDPQEVEALKQELAEARVELAHERERAEQLAQRYDHQLDDLTAAKDTARAYLRELNKLRGELDRARGGRR